MTTLSAFYGPNAGYVLDLYDQYRDDPASVDETTRAFFENWSPEDEDVPAESLSAPASTKAAPSILSPTTVNKVVGAARFARYVRELGHLAARLDPLGSLPPGDPQLELSSHDLTARDLENIPASVVGGPCAQNARSYNEAVRRLFQVYSGSVGYEDDHIQVAEEREWLRNAVESQKFFKTVTDDDKVEVLERLTEVECFERFLHTTFVGQKRFSIEGTDTLVPILDHIIRCSAVRGTREVVIGMAHRGRLNVLTHVLGKPYETIIAQFQSAHSLTQSVSGGGTRGWTGDVKYHLGARLEYTQEGQRQMPITLASNPSHLEFVNPVVEGRARAAQETRNKPGQPVQDPQASLAILIHGDAAFPGQGVVAETLNLSQLPGYRVGGTIHIIANNQIGFTTTPVDSRSTLYASDLAKGFEIPIVHVNADDPEACIAVARMACAYRDKFAKDFLIDLVGYRRWGHNEGDEPAFTQPRMYQEITAHPTVRQIWAEKLAAQGVVSPGRGDELVAEVNAKLAAAKEAASQATKSADEPATAKPPFIEPITALDRKRVLALNDALLERPNGFTGNPKLDKNLQRRKTTITAEGGIEWAHAEALAFGSILEDGIPIRLTGQDVQRGTFSQRHAVLHDPNTGELYCPLQSIGSAKASMGIYNSPLSEISTLGFEYGYSSHASGSLVLWEAQFGDFSNCAQVIVDQFLVSGAAKWRQAPSLVMLLPHGYEGQGPEHSSGRVERYLQLGANNNIRVLNCTTSAQYFHALRRQAASLATGPSPLIIMTPKSLLRHPRAGSSLKDITDGKFQPVLAGPFKSPNNEVTRLILCSGKVYVDLIGSEGIAAAKNLAVGRLEQLYPFPTDELGELISRFPALRQIIWMQEEPQNMGPWTFVAPRIREIISPAVDLTYVGRAESGSPAEGSLGRHIAEQDRIVGEALRNVPQVESQRSSVIHAA